MGAPTCCQLVCVPGQKRWHTHVCPNCESSWTHIAPTPMTQRKNREIHTCTKCGTEVYAFVAIEQQPTDPFLWAAVGAFAGLLISGLRRR
jgi:hypothetical protein